MFLPASGYCYFDGEASWEDGGSNGGLYWSSEQDSEYSAYYLYFGFEGDVDVDSDDKSVRYFSCRLVRE